MRAWMRKTSFAKLLALGALALLVVMIAETWIASARFDASIARTRARSEAVRAINQFHRDQHRWPANESEVADAPAGVKFTLRSSPSASQATYMFHQGPLEKTMTVKAR